MPEALRPGTLDADVECLSTLRALQELNLNHVANVKSLQGLKQLTQLEKLHIGYSDVDRQMLHELSSALPQLLSLDVSYSRQANRELIGLKGHGLRLTMCISCIWLNCCRFFRIVKLRISGRYTGKPVMIVGRFTIVQAAPNGRPIGKFSHWYRENWFWTEIMSASSVPCSFSAWSTYHEQRDCNPASMLCCCCRVITHTGAPDTFCYKNNSGGLTQLILDGYSDMRSLVALRLLGSFRSFSIRDCGVQTPWLVSLSHLTGLTLLDLSSNHDLTDGAMDFVALRTTLKQLAIQDLPLVTLEGLLSLAPLTRLQKLHTSLFPVTQPVESALLPVHLQRAVLDANAEVPSLFQADIIEEIF